MKKITLLLGTFLILAFGFQLSAQKVVVIGANHTSPDGITFVATQAISNGEIIYFTEDEYNNTTNVFTSGESVTTFTASTAIGVGEVIFLKEVSSNTLTVSCSSGVCGTAVVSTTPFALGSSGDQIYAYSDTDASPANGVTEIYSVFYSVPGNIPAGEDPTPDFPSAVVVDGFASGSPDRTEFNASRDMVSQAELENPANYTNGSANADLDVSAFTNLNLEGANPVVTIAVAPASVAEDGATNLVFTFSRTMDATNPLTVNFNVGGTATFSSDYSQTGAATFMAMSGTVTFPGGMSTVAINVDPTTDTDLEANETVELTVTAGAGYDTGAPGTATGTITNDDTANITPLVAVVGTNHTGSDAFSFVALDDITAGTNVYFTENPFDMGTLSFSGSEAVIQWTAPAGGISRGEVIVATETAANTFTNTCDSGICGTTAIVSGNFALASNGEAFYAYQDSDTDPSNGVTQVDAVLFTGNPAIPGGTIPAVEDPTTKYIGSVLVDGFLASTPSLTEYDPSKRGVTVDQANFQNTANWLPAQPAGTLSTVPFSNIIIATGSANPAASVTVSPASVLEDGATNLVFTFSLDETATTDITINFDVDGSATFSSDYSASGATTFDATSGTVVIANGTSSTQVTVDPTADADVEVQETVQLMIAAGTGYDGGSPNDATGTITNDDTSASMPLVALTGLNHTTADGFSFVAAEDIPAGTTVFFTEDEFDNTTLLFSSGEAVLQWTSPGFTVPKGDVIVVTETASDIFALACSGTGGADCGSLALITGSFGTATNGETFYAYKDDDTDPTNGVTDIYAVLFTGVPSAPGGNIPAAQDPSGIFLNALVVDGFPTSAPDRTEYDPTKRNVPVVMADFENIANWLHGQTNAILSTVPFTMLNITPVLTVTVDQAAAQVDPTDVSPIDFTAEFSEAVTGFDATDVMISGSANATTALVTPVSAEIYTISISGMTNSGTVIVTIPAGGAQDLDGNLNEASTSTDNEVTFNFTLPTVTVDQAATQVDPTNVSPIDFTAVFSKAVTGFDGSDVMISGSANATTALVTPVSAEIYTISISGMTNSGTVIVNVPAGGAQDLDGNLNEASTSTDNEVTFDIVPPTVRVDQAATQADPIDVSPIDFTAEFSEAVTGFDGSDVVISGTANATTAIVTAVSAEIYTISISGMTNSGTVIVTVPAGGAQDVDGNLNEASTSTDNEVTFNFALPTVAVDQAATQADPIAVSPIDFTAVFSKAVTGFDGSDVSISGTANATTAVVTALSAEEYAITVSGMTNDGTVIVTIPAGGAQDIDGNFNVASTSTDNSVTYDTTAPTVTAEQAGTQADPTATSPIHFVVEFSESVTGFSAGDVTLGGTANPTTANVTGAGSSYDVFVSGMISDGTVTVNIGAGVATDTSGNLNVASTSTDNEVTYDTSPPALTITGFVLINADTNMDIMPLNDGDVIDVTTLPTMNLNIRADATPDTESVRLELTGAQTKSMTENVDPYALFGDNSGNYNGNVFPLGIFNLEATAYSGNNLGGSAGTPFDIDFEFVDGNPLCAGFDVSIVVLDDISMCGAADGELQASVTLAESTDLTYSWSHNGGLNSPIATGLVAGTYTVTVTDGNDCIASTEFTLEDPELPVVTLAPFPVLEETSGDYVLTEGSPAGGEYSGLTINPADGIFFPDQFGPGDYEITYTYTDPATGCTNSAVRTLTVIPEDIDGTFVVLDATTDTELFALTEGLQIQKSVIGNTPLGIVFNPSVPVGGGVQFNLTGPINESRAEGSSPPYSVFGDIGVDIQGEPFPVGMYTLVANPSNGPTETVNFAVVDTAPCDIPDFIDPVAVCKDATVTLDASGNASIAPEDIDGGSTDNCEIVGYLWSPSSFGPGDIGEVQVELTVFDDNGNSDSCFATVTVNPYVPPLAVVDFKLIDADADVELGSINNGDIIDLGSLPTTNLSIRAVTEGGAESVRLELFGTQNSARTENVDPYALFGDISGDYSGNTFDIGPYSITGTPYSGNNLSGMMGNALTVNFSFTYSNGAKPSAVLFPNPASSYVTIDFDGDQDIKALQLHDGVGRMVRKYTGSEVRQGNQYIINISQLPDGIYYIRALDGLGNILQEPIVIEH